jgi:hypothetical protein
MTKREELVVVEVVRHDKSHYVAHVMVEMEGSGNGAAAFHGHAWAKRYEKFLRGGGFKTRRVIYRKVTR